MSRDNREREKKIKRIRFLRQYKHIIKLTSSLKSFSGTLFGINLIAITFYFSLFKIFDLGTLIIFLITSLIAFFISYISFCFIEIKAYSIEYNSMFTVEKLKRIENLYTKILFPDIFLCIGLGNLILFIFFISLYYYVILIISFYWLMICLIIGIIGFLILLKLYRPKWNEDDFSITEGWEDYEFLK